MSKKPLILGIESSCDETAASIITENEQGNPLVLSNIVSSQVEVHKEFGGVVPELAARSHVEKIDWIVQKAIDKSGKNIEEIDAVASTAGPGLIVCLSVGLSFGKAFAASLNKPFIAVNHLEGHALSPGLENKIEFPYLLLLISGGHTQYLIVRNVNNYEQLGTTIDDALGEAFDKTAKMLDLGYPGGPKIEAIAKQGDNDAFNFPRPMTNKKNLDFSFSGLKTAVFYEYKKLNNVSHVQKSNIAASFQAAVADTLLHKTKNALKQTGLNELVIGGGVASNKYIRDRLISELKDYKIFFPPIERCTDNGAMIAYAGSLYLKGSKEGLNFNIKPRWPLSELANG